jgi:methionine synthase II (cobalamin-independent)
MGIPTELVGSLPRPSYLQKAYADYDAGKISAEDFTAAQDKAVKDSLTNLAATGEKLITDGEQRASSFATYPITDTLGGTGLADNLTIEGGQYFAIFDDGHNRQLPRLVRGPFRYKTYAYENFAKSKPQAPSGHGLKQAVIAPSMLYLLYPLNGAVEGYSREEFEKDLVNECEKDIRGCFAAGAKRVSIDFTEGRLASKNDTRNPWTGKGLLEKFIELNNRVLGTLPPLMTRDHGTLKRASS